MRTIIFKEVTIMTRTYSEWRKYNEALKASDKAFQEYSKNVDAYRHKRKMLEIFVLTPIRIVIFPVALLVRVYKWVYHYDD